MKNKFYFKPFLKAIKSGETNNICMPVDDYFFLIKLKFAENHLIPNTKRYDLKRGLYGVALDINLWVNKEIPAGHIRIYPKDKEPSANSDSEWSINIKTSDFEKMIKLKAFW